MSHQIKRLRCTVLRAGCARGNFPSTIHAQSSTWDSAKTPAQPGPTAHQAAKGGALARHKPNPLSRQVARNGAAASAVDFLTGKAAEAGEIRLGWPLLDRDKPMPLDDRKRARPPRAILIGWLLGSRPTSGSPRPGERHNGVHSEATGLWSRSRLPSAFVARALNLAEAQRKAGRFEPMLLGSVRFMHSAVRMRNGKETICRLLPAPSTVPPSPKAKE